MKFVAFERAKQGTGASRRLRITGRTPGIVYGGQGQPQLIELDHNALWHALKKEAFHSTILDMELNGKENKVLLRDVQMHPFKQLVLHIDFQRVRADQEIRTKVPLHFMGEEGSPAVKISAAIISHGLGRSFPKSSQITSRTAAPTPMTAAPPCSVKAGTSRSVCAR